MRSFSSHTAYPDERRARRILLLGLGALWVLDGFLQLQPGMFTQALVTVVWQPSAQGEPGWLANLINESIHIAEPHLAVFNWSVVAVQLSIGALLLSGRRRLVRIGLWSSVVFGLSIWVFGEGLGQVLAGGATLLTGAPGSVLYYVVASLLLLLPVGTWQATRLHRVDVPTMSVALTLILGALLQLSPSFWTSLGLADPFGQASMMPQPTPLRYAVSAAAAGAVAAPVALNAILVAVLLALAVLLILLPHRPWVWWTTLALLTLVWLVGQDAGMLFSGMATDPNTAPALALLLCSGWALHPSDTAPPAPG